MNFEELESAWAAQQSAPTPVLDAAELKRAVVPELERRGRFLGYGLFIVIFSLVITPLLTVANYRYAPPPNPAWHWISFSLWMLLLVIWLLALLRAVRQHGALLQQSTRSLRDLAAVSLTHIEAEMREYRTALWLWPALVVFQLVGIYLEFPVPDHGWTPFGLRAVFIVGLPLGIGAVVWRHYQVNLKPAQARQQYLLQQLS